MGGWSIGSPPSEEMVMMERLEAMVMMELVELVALPSLSDPVKSTGMMTVFRCKCDDQGNPGLSGHWH